MENMGVCGPNVSNQLVRLFKNRSFRLSTKNIIIVILTWLFGGIYSSVIFCSLCREVILPIIVNVRIVVRNSAVLDRNLVK